MIRPPLEVVSPNSPQKVTRQRIVDSLTRAGQLFQGSEAETCLSVHAGETALRVCLKEERGVLSVRGRWETGLPFDEVEYHLFAATDSWNRTNPFPTLYTISDSDDAAVVIADFSVLVGMGLMDKQLDHTLAVSVEQGTKALEYMNNVARDVLGLNWQDT